MSDTSSGEAPDGAVDRLKREVQELRRSRRRLAEGADADRRAIERDLHDGVQQLLVALAVDLRRLAGLMDGDPVAARALIGDLTASVREALDQSTELAQRIYPSLLEGRGLASAIRSAGDRLAVTVAVEVPARTTYPPDLTAAVYWSCLEALSVASTGSAATVTVLDADGRLAFEVGIADPVAGDRLQGLRDRIEALDGHLSVDEAPDGGARIHGWLPLSR